MKAKLIEPKDDHCWSLQFFDIPGDYERTKNPIKSSIWYWAQHFGGFWHVSPFLQGDSEDWMMIEFFSKSQSHILEASLSICHELKVTLEI